NRPAALADGEYGTARRRDLERPTANIMSEQVFQQPCHRPLPVYPLALVGLPVPEHSGPRYQVKYRCADATLEQNQGIRAMRERALATASLSRDYRLNSGDGSIGAD